MNYVDHPLKDDGGGDTNPDLGQVEKGSALQVDEKSKDLEEVMIQLAAMESKVTSLTESILLLEARFGLVREEERSPGDQEGQEEEEGVSKEGEVGQGGENDEGREGIQSKTLLMHYNGPWLLSLKLAYLGNAHLKDFRCDSIS